MFDVIKVYKNLNIYLESENFVCMPYDYVGGESIRPIHQRVSCTDAAYLVNAWNAGSKSKETMLLVAAREVLFWWGCVLPTHIYTSNPVCLLEQKVSNVLKIEFF